MTNGMTAELLETSVDGYASAASVMMQRAPNPAGAPRSHDHRLWAAHFKQRILELATAVRLGEPQLFVQRINWLARAYAARGNELAELESALTSLRSALVEELPEAHREAATGPVELALSGLSSAPYEHISTLDPTNPADHLALEYIAACLEGRPEQAEDLLLEAAENRFTPAEVYTRVLVPVQKEIGQLWHAGDAGIAEERLVSETTRALMTRLVARHAPAIKADRSMLAAAVPGNAHDIGLRMVTDMFRLAGWRCLFLGANVPASEIANAAVSQDVDLVVLSATLATQLKELEHAIAMIRAAGARARILAGGLAFADAPALWRQLGADGYASDLDAAVAAGERLVAASH